MPTDTFTIVDEAHDGYVQRTGATYPPTGSFNVVTNGISVENSLKAGPTYDVRVTLLRWDTSSIPDNAVITEAVLRTWTLGRQDDDGRNVTADWYDAGTIADDDWTSTAGTDAHAGTTLEHWSGDPGDRDISLINLENINKTGVTGLRLHIDGGEPTVGENWISFVSFGDDEATSARLVVTHSDPQTFPRAIELV